jgi:hypothetical protein
MLDGDTVVRASVTPVGDVASVGIKLALEPPR